MFDDIIKNKADEHEAPVPPDAWNNIVKKKKKRRFAFWWWSGGAVLLAVLFTAGYFLFNNKKDAPVAAVDTTSEKQVVQPADDINKEDSKTQASLQEKNADANGTAQNDITDTDRNSRKQNIPVEETGFITAANTPEENTSAVAGDRRKTRNTKGKLKTQQTNPGFDESVAANEQIKTTIDKPVAVAEAEDETGSEENRQVTIASAPDKKVGTAEEEKKTEETTIKTENPQKTEPSKKENIVAAKHKGKKHWFIEAAAIPFIASSHYNKNISFNRTLALNNSITEYKANLTSASIEPAVAFSLLAHKELNKKVSIGTGLQYMLLKEKMTIKGTETNTTHTIIDRLVNGQLVPDTVTTVTAGERSITAVNSYQLFSIPVFVQYSIIQKQQWSLGAVGGIYFNISGNYKNEINRNAAAPLLTAPGTANRSNTGMDLFAGIRIGKKLSKRLDFFAMPSMRWSLTKYNIENSLLDKNINQAGVGFGLCYQLK